MNRVDIYRLVQNYRELAPTTDSQILDGRRGRADVGATDGNGFNRELSGRPKRMARHTKRAFHSSGPNDRS